MLKLAYSNLEFQNFLGEDPRTPCSRGGEGREGRRGRGKGRIGERRREGGEEWGVVGRGGALDMGSPPPPETCSGSAPAASKWTAT